MTEQIACRFTDVALEPLPWKSHTPGSTSLLLGDFYGADAPADRPHSPFHTYIRVCCLAENQKTEPDQVLRLSNQIISDGLFLFSIVIFDIARSGNAFL
jgi:hypothetical protein